MSAHTMPGLIALVIGGGLGMLLFVPFVAVQYRRMGRLTFGQLTLWAAFLVYSLALWTYTLLPLPDSATIRCLDPQLMPLQFLADVQQYPLGSIGELVRNPAVQQVALNVVLFVPLGFFLRLIWQRGVVAATLVGFAVSLLIELTQLTGIWGVYACAYRLFDVDDLLVNTAGAALGGLLSLALRRRPSSPADAASRAFPVTFWRRVLGAVCDMLCMLLLGWLAALVVALLAPKAATGDGGAFDPIHLVGTLVPFVVVGVVTLVTGGTLGDLAVMVRWRPGRIRSVVLARALRYLAGIGGWQLLASFASPLDGALVLASVIALIAMRSRAGLPGLASGMTPVDARADSRTSGAPLGR